MSACVRGGGGCAVSPAHRIRSIRLILSFFISPGRQTGQSISKPNAAHGFRSGWCIGPPAVIEALQALSETMLSGNQSFIAYMAKKALRDDPSVAAAIRQRFAAGQSASACTCPQ